MEKQPEKDGFGKTYVRRPGTDDSGRDYETKITALLALRCATMEDTKDMWLGSNADNVGDFDDIVLSRRTSNGERIMYLVQLKHQENPESIHRYEFTYDKNQSGKRKKNNQNLSLSKYNARYIELKQTLDNPEKNEPEIIQHLREVDDTIFILFTNKNVNDCDFLQNSNDDRLNFLDTSCAEKNIYKFVHSNVKDVQSNFLQRLFLLANQVHVNHVNDLIENTIEKLLGICYKPTIDFNKISNKFVEFIRAWIKGSQDNNSKIYFTLTKCDIINKLVDILLSPYKYNFSEETYTFYDCSRKSIWNKIVKSKKVIVIEANDLDCQFLRQYVGSEIKQYLNKPAKVWSEKLTKKTKKSFYKKHEILKTHMLKLIGKNENITMLDVYSSLWFDNKIPLLLKINLDQDYANILKILKLSNYGLDVVVIKDKSVELKIEERHSDIQFITLFDLSVDNKNEILKQPVKLQNRLDVVLGNLINESMYNFITCNDVIHILKGSFNIGNQYEPLSDLFIPRQLSRVFLNPIILCDITDEIFIVTNVGNGGVTPTPKLDEATFLNNIVIVEDSEDPEDFMNPSTERRTFIFPTMLTEINDKNFVISTFQNGEVENIAIPLCRLEDFNFKNNLIVAESSEDPASIQNLEYKRNTIHQMVVHNSGFLEWKNSCGAINNIQKYVYKQKLAWHSFEDDKNYFLNGTHIISADPGMGKSTFVNFLTLHVPTTMWVIKISLNDYPDYYENIQNELAFDHLNFFNDRILDKCNNPELSHAIFQNLLDAKKVLVILDGFDEISPYKRAVINIAKCLHDAGFPLWLTTRPRMQCELEEIFCTIALTLKPFTIRNQKIYLTKYFSETCSLDNIKQENFQCIIQQFVEKLLATTERNFNDFQGKFMEIPLQTKMLAEVFCGHCKESLRTGNIIVDETFNLLDLYERFIKRKIGILCEKFGKDARNARMFIEKQQKLFAVKCIFSSCKLRRINEQLREFFNGEEYKMHFLHREGFVAVEQIDNAEKLDYNINFTHRTFAEFLAAQWLSENLVDPDVDLKIVLRKLLRYEHISLICEMFNFVLAKNFPLHLAVLNGKLDEAERILQSDPTSADKMDKGGRTILHIIVITYRKSVSINPVLANIMEKIRNNKVLINTRDSVNKFTALDYLLFFDAYFLANEMRKKIPELTITDCDTSTGRLISECAEGELKSLFHAVLRYCASRDLLLNCVDKNTSIESYCTFLAKYSKHQNTINNYVREFDVSTISELFQCQLPIAHYYNNLDMACALGTEENVNYLLLEGVQINSRSTNPLHCAVRHKRLEIVKLLLNNGESVDKLDRNGNIALHWSASSEITAELLLKGANINKQNDLGDTSLNIAIKNKYLDVAKLLLLKGADCKIKNYIGYSCLHYAAENGCNDIISELIYKGECVNKQKNDDEAPLHLAVAAALIDTVELLLSKGADVNLQSNYGKAPLHDAVIAHDPLDCTLLNNRISIIRLLLNKGADINIQDEDGCTPLHYVIICDSDEETLLFKKFYKIVATLLRQRGAITKIRFN